MKTAAIALMILVASAAFAQEQKSNAAQAVAFFDVLDLPARIDEPKLQKIADNYSLKCALANRGEERLVGVRLSLMVVDSNGRVTRLTWNEATDVAAYSIKAFEFHPPLKDPPKNSKFFLALDEVAGNETVWRTVDAEKLLRNYARGDNGLVPKVQKLQNNVESHYVPVIPISMTPPGRKP